MRAIAGVLGATHGPLLPGSHVIHHIIPAVVSKWPWQPLVWFLKIVFHSKYLKLQEEQNRNDWFTIFFFCGWETFFFFFFKHILSAVIRAKRPGLL